MVCFPASLQPRTAPKVNPTFDAGLFFSHERLESGIGNRGITFRDKVAHRRTLRLEMISDRIRGAGRNLFVFGSFFSLLPA